MFAMSRAASPAAATPTRVLVLAGAAIALALTVAGCSTGGPSKDADSLSVSDTWVKAADSGMTAGFGEIHNSSGHDITIVSGSSPATSEIQLHEVVDETMREVDGGFVVPAGGTFSLEPGGYHLMFMDVPSPIVAGDEETITLTLGDGSTLTFTAVAKDFAGGNETYDDGMSMSPSDGMDMGDDSTMSPSASMGG